MPRKANRWNKWRKDAPKVPDQTCPLIDKIITDLTNLSEKNITITSAKYEKLVKKLERLRKQNEQLRESGIYWYEKCKDHLKEIKVDNSWDLF